MQIPTFPLSFFAVCFVFRLGKRSCRSKRDTRDEMERESGTGRLIEQLSKSGALPSFKYSMALNYKETLHARYTPHVCGTCRTCVCRILLQPLRRERDRESLDTFVMKLPHKLGKKTKADLIS